MKQIHNLVVVGVLLMAIIATLSPAVNAKIAGAIADITIDSDITIDYSKLSDEKKAEIIKNAEKDYQTGKTKDLIIPGAKSIEPDVYYPNTTKKGVPLVDNMISPPDAQLNETIMPLSIMPGEY